MSLSYKINYLIGILIGLIKILPIKLLSLFLKPRPNQLAFIPHGGMYGNGYDLVNYKSDNALSLLVYMINRYGNTYSYRIACDIRQYDGIKDDIKKRFSNINIICVPFLGPHSFRWSLYKELIRSSYIFTCEGYPLPFKRKWHKVVFLSYFKPFKDDYKYHQIARKEHFDKLFDVSISTSSTYSNIVAHAYNVPFSKFVSLGFSRDDMLLSDYYCPPLDKAICSSVDYEVKNVFLYTPTHRDYESQTTEERELLGFKVHKEKFENFLRKNGIIIICKIHTAQNKSVIDNKAINGVFVHSATEEYGLCELLQRADCLITDYTSTYFDYLLLDRPVLFNFYDVEKYEKSRGFSFDPLQSIIAGDVFIDEESFYKMAQKVVDGIDEYAQKRKFVKDLMHKYIDNNSSKRICDYLFN